MADEKATYRLSSASYLRMQDNEGNPLGEPVWLDEGTLVGPGTPYNFHGPLSPNMYPTNPAAEKAKADYEKNYPNASLGLKEFAPPGEGGAAPFDPAAGAKTSSEEKERAAKLEAENADLKKRLEALEKSAEEAKADPAKSTTAPVNPSAKKTS